MRGLLHSPERKCEPCQLFQDAFHFDSCHRIEIIPATALQGQGANFHSLRVDLDRDTVNIQRQRQRHTALAVMTQTRSVKGKELGMSVALWSRGCIEADPLSVYVLVPLRESGVSTLLQNLCAFLIRLVLLRHLSVAVLSLFSLSVCVAMATFNI